MKFKKCVIAVIAALLPLACQAEPPDMSGVPAVRSVSEMMARHLPYPHPGAVLVPDNPAKIWTDMSVSERAEIWPFLSNGMQRQYWNCMTKMERKALSELLTPLDREAIQSRYVIHVQPVPTDPVINSARSPMRQFVLGPVLTHAQKAELHRQLREFSSRLAREAGSPEN